MKALILPSEPNFLHITNVKRNIRTLTKICTFAQLYFDPKDAYTIFEQILPFFTLSLTENAYAVVGLLNLMFPTAPSETGEIKQLPQQYLPTLFHIWSLVNRSRFFDSTFLDLFSRMARDSLVAGHVPFGPWGIFQQNQSSLIFTAVLRLLDIPVGQATSPYSSSVDNSAGLATMLERDPKKHPTAHHIARWIIMSFSPDCLDSSNSIMANLEGLIQAVETFFHPSNSGSWTKILSQLVFFLADFFVMRWNREKSGEMDIPVERRLTDVLKRRFVLCLREVVFMGIYAKSSTAVGFSLSTLQSLAYLEPTLILPGALQRIYPSMQGLVEVHRTTSSLRSLQVLSRIMIRTKGFRCHATTMLGLALPGIDANDLEKTLYTLSYVQSICYSIPFYDLTESTEAVSGSMLAAGWIASEMDRMQIEGPTIDLDYENKLSEMDEELILRSSTASLAEFLSSFLTKVFTVFENLPDPSRVRSGSPEENFINALPATFTPLFATLSPDLYDLALNKITEFVSNNVIHQARDAMAFICNALCKINPGKALKRLVPILIQSIRTEIDENGAASTRNISSDILPRDRGLVWHVHMLSMCVVHAGVAVLHHQNVLFSIAAYMQQKCRGIPTVHISNYIHHLLHSLTTIYPMDYSIYEADVFARGLAPSDWGMTPDPRTLNIKWHVPCTEEVEFAAKLFKYLGEGALQQLTALTVGNSTIKRDGVGKEWSDELSQNLVLVRMLLSGISSLFDAKAASGAEEVHSDPNDVDMVSANADSPEPQGNGAIGTPLDDVEEDEIKLAIKYPAGYLLNEDNSVYKEIHSLRKEAGLILHKVHDFLVEKQEDDVLCFTSLYSAYRSWFTDVGLERSAHTLDRALRLLSADISPYKVSGLRKQYPRSLLLQRAHIYHLQRLRHNSSPRSMSSLDKQLLLDLAQSSVSPYTAVRRVAQSAGEAALKVIIGGRSLVVPYLIRAFENGVATSDYPRIKGAMYSLLFGSLLKAINRDWLHAPSLLKTYIAANAVDRPSIQGLCSSTNLAIIQLATPSQLQVILNKRFIQDIAPTEDVEPCLVEKTNKVAKKRDRIESDKAALSEELVEIARNSHWRKASRTVSIAVALGLRFQTIASQSMIDLVSNGAIDPHPGLRALYSSAFVGVLSVVNSRANSNHSYENYITDKQLLPTKTEIITRRDDPHWTEDFLEKFAQPEADYYVDHDHPGWLVWDKTVPAYKVHAPSGIIYDDIEQKVLKSIGHYLSRSWFSKCFEYLKQEPRDSGADRFRLSNVTILGYAFEVLIEGYTKASFSDIKEELTIVFGDGSDKHQHRATAEILGSLLISISDKKPELRDPIWDYVLSIVLKVFSDGLTPENSAYWMSFLHTVIIGRDPRRSWPLVNWLASFRLDMSSNAAFKESSKIYMLQQCIRDLGWHFRLEKPIIQDFLAHLDHPYKGVREAVALTLATIFRTRYHESYKDIEMLIELQKSSSSLGTRPYQPSEDLSNAIHGAFNRIEKWKKELDPRQPTSSSYYTGSKTVLLWLDSTISSYECIELLQFFPDVIIEPLLSMMDVKDDAEMANLAYLVFRHLANVPYPIGEETRFLNSLVRIGQQATAWHHRLRSMINMQIIYFRRLFLLSYEQQQGLFDCVALMLEDSQLEVRLGAAATLSGMIRCSPVVLRTSIVKLYNARFTKMLLENPLPKKPRDGLSARSTNTSTPTPEHTRLILVRHAAVLGLGALVQAFPYASPPPDWIPGILTTLARKANDDPGVVGKSVKSILSDFKKTRQDTWHMDLKVINSREMPCQR